MEKRTKAEDAQERRRSRMRKLYHSLCSTLGIGEEERLAMLGSYGVTSSRDMSDADLSDLCNRLGAMLPGRKQDTEMDRLRKRLIASIGAWLRTEGRESNIDLIKAIACRATGYDTFNKIPKERLHNLTWAFNQKRKDAETVRKIAVMPKEIWLN